MWIFNHIEVNAKKLANFYILCFSFLTKRFAFVIRLIIKIPVMMCLLLGCSARQSYLRKQQAIVSLRRFWLSMRNFNKKIFCLKIPINWETRQLRSASWARSSWTAKNVSVQHSVCTQEVYAYTELDRSYIIDTSKHRCCIGDRWANEKRRKHDFRAQWLRIKTNKRHVVIVGGCRWFLFVNSLPSLSLSCLFVILLIRVAILEFNVDQWENEKTKISY